MSDAGAGARQVSPYWTTAAVPAICRDHNALGGCSDGKRCARLHICERFVTSTCTKGAECSAGHDVTADQPLRVLARNGIDVCIEGVDGLLEKLRASLSGKTKRVGRTRPDTAFDSSLSSGTQTQRGRKETGKQALGICSHYNREVCRSGERCGLLHACRSFILDQCHSSRCSKSHDLASSHDRTILLSHGFDVVSMGTERVRKRLKALLESAEDGFLPRCSTTSRSRSSSSRFMTSSKHNQPRGSILKDDVFGIPDVCVEYNSKGSGCTTNGCQYLHLCSHFVTGTCKFNPCRKSHDLMSDQPRKVLARCGFDVTVLNEQFIMGHLKANLSSTKLQQKLKERKEAELSLEARYTLSTGAACSAGKMRQHPLGGFLQSETQEPAVNQCVRSLNCPRMSDVLSSRPAVVDICSKYNYKDGCSVANCQKLHLCRHFVEGNCKFNPCKRSHWLVPDQPNTAPATRGFYAPSMWGKGISDQLRESLTLTKNHQRILVPVDGSINSDTRLMHCKLGSTMPHTPKRLDMESKQSAVVDVCSKYNYKDGCNLDNCQKLHVCRHFVEGTCKFDPCKRSHSLRTDRSRAILVRSGFDVDAFTEYQILDRMRKQLRKPVNTEKHKEQSCSLDDVFKRRSESSDSSADPKVCSFHLFGRCIYKNNDCFNYHSRNGLPYQWQWNNSADSEYGECRTATLKWFDFCQTANLEIESKFCDVSEDRLKVQDDAIGGLVVINFESMTFGGQLTSSGVIRRLGTDPVATSTKRNRYTTVWNWYWQSEDHQGQWEAYPGSTPTSSNDGLVSSLELELKYLANPLGRMLYQTAATTNQCQGRRFLINMKQMTRTELSTQEVIKVRRRPVLFQPLEKPIPDEVSIKDQSSATSMIRYPECWNLDVMKDLSDVDYFLEPVMSTGLTADEYKKVASLFNKTMPNIELKSVLRIQNRDLWESFDAFKTRMNRKRSTPVIAMSLFHGSKRQYLEAICQQGFDWRMCGTSVGTLWGKGSYFARDAKYSMSYTDCRKMFIVQVLVGDYTNGHPSYVRPPPKDPTKPYQDLYDSVVNDIKCPSIFVSFEKNQSYPEYLIEY